MKIKYKQKSIIVFIVKSLLILLSIFSVSCVSMKSKATNLLLDCKLDKYYAFHDVSLVNTDIAKELVVNGTLTATNSRLNKVSINGKATIANSVVNDDIFINGKLTIDKVVIKKNLIGHGELVANNSQIITIDMEAKSIILNDTTVSSIRAREFKNTTIYLRNGSVVTGDIIFDTGRGRVIIDKESKVKGSITGKAVKKDMLEVTVGKSGTIK